MHFGIYWTYSKKSWACVKIGDISQINVDYIMYTDIWSGGNGYRCKYNYEYIFNQDPIPSAKFVRVKKYCFYAGRS